ncbi:MAG: hypothetical protein RLZZ422_2603 [Pseudomonadota bacterium]|jgi:TPR repeat protein
MYNNSLKPFVLCMLLIASISSSFAEDIAQAEKAYKEAYKRYTQLATGSSVGDRDQAYQDYQTAYFHYKELVAKQGEPSTTTPTLNTEGIAGIESIENESEVIVSSTQPEVSTTSAIQALKQIKQQAKQGNGAALELLAWTYQVGYEVDVDPYRRIELLQQAAKAGNADAMALLANEYDSGIWLKANPKQAKQLRQQAAKQGSVLAQWELGL